MGGGAEGGGGKWVGRRARVGERRLDGSFISAARSLPLFYYYWRSWWVHGPTEL